MTMRSWTFAAAEDQTSQLMGVLVLLACPCLPGESFQSRWLPQWAEFSVS